MELTEIIGLLTLLSLPLNSYVVWRLAKERFRSVGRNRLLIQNLIAASSVLLFALVYGIIFVNNDQPIPWLSVTDTKLITRTVAIVIAYVPALVFIWYYRPRRKK